MHRRNKGSRGRCYSRSLINEINVTPFVDVMLVLLIIFMVTAPFLETGVNIDLPDVKAPSLVSQNKPLIVSVTKKGVIYLGHKKMSQKKLLSVLSQRLKKNPKMKVYVQGDQKTSYGRVIKVWSLIKSAGFKKVALIFDLPDVKK